MTTIDSVRDRAGGPPTDQKSRKNRTRQTGQVNSPSSWLKPASHVVFVMALLFFWWAASEWFIDPFYIGRPGEVAETLAAWTVDPGFWTDLRVTLWETLLGFIIGAAAATVAAFLLSEMRRTREFVTPYIDALYGLPKSALAPLLIIWFGVGLTPKVVLAASMVFFLVFYNTLTGLLSIDKGLLNVVRLGGATRYQTWTTLKMQAVFPYWITGAKVAMPIALIGAIIGEFISSDRGMGFRILQAGNMFRMDEVLAVLIVLSVISLLMIAGLARMERYFLRWRVSGD